MDSENMQQYRVGWVGMGRMGSPMAERLLAAGCQLSVWNRTQSKAARLVDRGATLASQLTDIADSDVIFTMVSTQDVLESVLFGSEGILSGDSRPKMVVDCSSISAEVSADIRSRLTEKNVSFLAAPVSGNGKCVKAGKLAIVASGSEDAYETAKPLLDVIGGMGVTYVGEGELARVVKICHNVFLGVVTQSLAEVTLLAQAAGVSRHDFLDFMNKSVMGSIFTRYKAPGWVNQNYVTTFTPELMRKDMDLGLGLGKKHEVSMPTASKTRDIIQASIDDGNSGDIDFSIVLKYMADSSGIELKSEDVEVLSGLEVGKL